MSNPGEELRPRQRALAEHYVRLGASPGVKSKAAILAGYSENGAVQRASQELKKVQVAEYVSLLLEEARKQAAKEGRKTKEQEEADRQAVSIKTAADRLRFYSRAINAAEDELNNQAPDMGVVRTGIAAARQMDAIERTKMDEQEQLKRLVAAGEAIRSL
jgi:phage terminase small subunit